METYRRERDSCARCFRLRDSVKMKSGGQDGRDRIEHNCTEVHGPIGGFWNIGVIQ